MPKATFQNPIDKHLLSDKLILERKQNHERY